jgi:phage terminase Nu1 subunit (DNA packaging protein)
VESSDGKFTIADIDRAVHGDIDAEKLRKTTEEADNLALRNAEKRKQLVDIERFSRGLEKKVSAMKQVVLDSGIPEDKQDAILNAIADLLAG